MTELELYKYINDNDIEWHWVTKDYENNIEDVIIFPRFHELDEFNKLLPYSMFSDDSIKCHMMKGYLAIYMSEICNRFDIEITNVFNKEK